MTPLSIARDGEELPIQTNNQDWTVSWHPASAPPAGQVHGAAGVCVTASGEIVLISADGVHWDFPAGRTEDDETWEQTLRRELREEACATVTEARLLGFGRGVCVTGPQAGQMLVRSFWRAQVVLDVWQPAFEITHRRVVVPHEALAHLPPLFLPILHRAMIEAGVL